MRTLFFLLAFGLASALTVQAQTTTLKIGFADVDNDRCREKPFQHRKCTTILT